MTISSDHVVHHMLSIYALGATSDQIREHYKRAISVVPPAHPIDVNLSQSLIDREKWKIHIGDHLYYHSYLAFFEREIEAKGYINVMQEYLFAEDERAEDMLCRLFAGEWRRTIADIERKLSLCRTFASLDTFGIRTRVSTAFPNGRGAGSNCYNPDVEFRRNSFACREGGRGFWIQASD
jgi:hypothetical protein